METETNNAKSGTSSVTFSNKNIWFCISLRSWRDCARARNFLPLGAKPRAKFPNSTRLLPILLAICAAFSTRVRDRSSRGYPLPPATQASFAFTVGQ